MNTIQEVLDICFLHQHKGRYNTLTDNIEALVASTVACAMECMMG